MIDMYFVNQGFSDYSIEVPIDFYYPFIFVISVGTIAWLRRLDILAMRAYLR